MRPIAVPLVLLALAGCTATGGTGLSGYGRIATPAAGTPAEAVVGGLEPARTTVSPDLAPLMGPRARQIAAEAQYRALEDSGAGVSVRWRTPDDAVRGEVVPGPLYAVNVQRCRDFTHAVEKDGARWSRRSTACRDAGGTWELIS